MKAGLVSHLASPSAPTGAEKSLALLARALDSRGHDVAVVAPGPWCLADSLEASGVEVVRIDSRACWLVQWGRQPMWRQAVRYLRYRVPDPGHRRMMVWLDHFWPDVVYVNCLPQLKGAEAAWALGLPVVWHIREILPPGHRRRWFARRLRRCATRIVAVSHAVADWLAEEGLDDRVEVVHNGCVPPRSVVDRQALRRQLGLPEEATLVGFFAQIVRHKGAVDLVRAASLVLESVPSLGVIFAGAGPREELDRLRAAIAETSCPQKFSVLGPREDVGDLLTAVDLVAVPSRWPDPLPRSVMEAMAAGRPVVANRTGGVAEMVVEGKTGFMVEPGDTEGLANRIERLVRDPALSERMGAAAAGRAKTEFSVANHVDAMERILSEAASG